jgi:hypothetical protein
LPSFTIEDLKKHADRFDIMRIFYTYVISFFLFNSLVLLAFSNAGLTQFLISLAKIKWFFFILFMFMALLQGKMRVHLLVAIGVEVFIGLASYFSDFKTVFFYVFFVLLVFLYRVKFRHFIFGMLLVVTGIGIGIYWTSIKSEYRQFLNKGTGTQTVSVSRDEAINKLLELSQKGQFGKEDASVNFLDRLQYCFHLAKAMDRVPAVIPYQNGDNLGQSISFVYKPRLFFPDKPVYDASEKASRYTGIGYARVMQGTSVSLGYFADCYVDFGVPGMFFPLIFLGLVYGLTYNYFIRNASDNLLFNISVVGTLYMEYYAYEMDSTYLIGRLSVNLILFFLLTRFFFPFLLNYYTRESDSSSK